MTESSIFWCGAVVNHQGLLCYRGEAPAASHWSRGLLRGIQQQGIRVEGFSPIWDTLYPKGRLFPGSETYLEADIPQTLIRYFNFPGIRTASVAFSLERAINARLRTGTKPLAILNYNTYPYYCRALKKIAHKHPSIPWVNVVLDLDDPTEDAWAGFNQSTRGAAAAVFLSWWGFVNAPTIQKLHLDGGWLGDFPKVEKPAQNVFIYCGSMANIGGLRDIVEAIRFFPRQDVRFEFFGKGLHEGLKELAATDRRIRLRGFVPDAELESECQRATAFLCPRELEYHGTKMIFPSKLLFYLKFQKPVLSHHLPGLSPDYGDILTMPSGNSPAEWGKAMNLVLGMKEEEQTTLAARIRSFMLNKKWNMQAARLITFLESLNKPKRNLQP